MTEGPRPPDPPHAAGGDLDGAGPLQGPAAGGRAVAGRRSLLRRGPGPARWRRPDRPPLRVWVWTAATVALVVVAGLLWRGSDAAATSRTTASPAGLPAGTPAGALSPVWSATAGPVPEQVVQSGRVIVGGEHGITALDAVTGDPAWHYTRSNARLCGLTAVDGLAVAVFRTAARCDEAVALRADTGRYAWTRNVNFRSDMTLTSTARIVLAASPFGVVTLDPEGDNIRWRYAAPEGCRFDSAVAGTAGVAVLQRCAGTATQVRLLDGFTGEAHWARDVPPGDVTLLGADWTVTLLAGDQLRLLSRDDGAVTVAAALPAGAADQPPPQETAVDAVVLVWARGRLIAADSASRTLLWQRPARGLPAGKTDGKDAAAVPQVLVPEDGGFVLRDLSTGAELGRATVTDLPPGGTSTPVGPVVVYRLADRVLGFR